MRKNITGLTIISFAVLMIIPVYGELGVSTVSLDKSFYIDDESIKFVGTTNGTDRSMVSVIIYNPNGDFKAMLGDPLSDPDGTFETIPKKVSDIFTTIGTYSAIAFTDEQKVEEGVTILLEYDGSKVGETETYTLTLNSISDKVIDEGKTVSFTATINDDTVEGIVFSLGDSAPSNATIDAETGQFIWTTTELDGGSIVTFDIIATLDVQEDRESIKITVKEVDETPVKEPEPKESEPEPVKEPEPKELGIAAFVDESKDPQTYVDRYNNEASYKEWFDSNYPEYSSIYQAVGLEEPKELVAFVDPNLDPQYYVDRYTNEPKYKEWFDKTYPEMTIYDAVGLEDPALIEPEAPKEEDTGECGPGTELINGVCELVNESNSTEGGGCLIATATFGSEMAPQVQLLREIRDNKVLTTNSGESFMKSFNQFYYSFSPHIADYERENPVFKEVVKLGITPILSTLSILSVVDINSEQDMLGVGIGIIIMNVGIYFVAPAVVIYGIKKISAKF